MNNWKWAAIGALSLLLAIFITAADNVSGWNGQPMGSDQIGGVDYLRVKLIEGADGTNDGDISAANPLPSSDATAQSTLTTINTSVGSVETALEATDGLTISRGNATGLTGENKFGQNEDIDVGTEDIIDAGGTLVETLVGTPATVALYSASANDVAAAGTLTISGTPVATQTVTIDTKTYTWVLDPATDNVDGNVFHGNTAAEGVSNLVAAITLGAGSGTAYAAAMTAPPATVLNAIDGAGDTVVLYATSAIATTETMANGAWGAANAVAGTGARTVTVLGLDASGALQSETMNMTGVTLIDSTSTWSFIYRMLVATAGSVATNDDVIKCVDNPETEIYAQIGDGYGQTRMSCYKIPTGSTGYLMDYDFALATSPPEDADVACFVYAKPTGGAYNLKHSGAVVTGGTTVFQHQFCCPPSFAAGTIIKLTATTDTNNTNLIGNFTLILDSN